jgi:hypothetical protein
MYLSWEKLGWNSLLIRGAGGALPLFQYLNQPR